MRPNLKGHVARPQKFCQCSPCAEFSSLGHAGRWVSHSEYDQHQERERKRAAANQYLNGMGQFKNGETSLVGLASTYLGEEAAEPPPFSDPAVVEELKAARSALKRPGCVVGGILYFETPPSPNEHISTSQLSISAVDQLCALDTKNVSNSPVIAYQHELIRIKALSRSHATHQDSAVRDQAKLLARDVSESEKDLRGILLNEWRCQRKALTNTNFFDTTRYFTHVIPFLPPTVVAIYLVVASLHLLSSLSGNSCTFLLNSLSVIAEMMNANTHGISSTRISGAIRTDIRTILDTLDLHPASQPYVCCPKCHFLQRIGPNFPASGALESCTNDVLDHGTCGAKLYKKRNVKGGEIIIPIKPYHQQPAKEYLSRLFSRKDLEQYLYCDPTKSSNCSGNMSDVWDAPGLRDFNGPDDKPFFKSQDEARLIFALNMDGFNPYGNREAGKKVSVGAMYMVCLNLPPSLRYKPENIYLVGVIPGPNAPSDHEINHLLKPIIDEFSELWATGVFLSRTTRHPRGYRVRCAIGPLVCDLPAARQMSGFAHFSSKNFCSVCTQPRDEINDLSLKSWPLRTWKTHLAAATRWKDAKSTAEQEAEVKNHGVRWSELLRLSYWDPTKFTMIDSMHAFYLRLLQHHCRSIWGMDIKFEDGDGATFDALKNPVSDEELEEANQILRHGTEQMLSNLRAPVLSELCRQTSTLAYRRKKKQLIAQLLEYRRCQEWFIEAGAHIGPSSLDIFHAPKPVEFQSKVVPTREAVEKFFSTKGKTKFNAALREDLRIIFRVKVLPSLEMSEEAVAKLLKPELKEYLQQARYKAGVTDVNGVLLGSKPEKTRVLGKATLHEIRRDINRMAQPSWVSRAPAHPGEKKWGKLTADQWKTFCLQNLPVTLTRLWGHYPEGSTERRRLDNFMHLVSAIKIANMHTINEDRIQEYEREIQHYLTTLQVLYPGTNITPYQHLSLHFGDHLRRFGPVQAWRCFPFERFNYILQNFPTNERFGKLEKTMFDKFCCSQNLQALYRQDVIPKSAHPIIDAFAKAYASDVRGTRLSDSFEEHDHFDMVEGPKTYQAEEFYDLRSADYMLYQKWMHENRPNDKFSRKVAEEKEIYRFGQRFTTQSSYVHDSNVAFRAGGSKDWKAGSIVHIFSRAHVGEPAVQTFAIIQPYKALPLVGCDPYRRYPIVGGRLFLNAWEESPILVDVKDIDCHFVSCVLKVDGVDGECHLALPLNKL